MSFFYSKKSTMGSQEKGTIAYSILLLVCLTFKSSVGVPVSHIRIDYGWDDHATKPKQQTVVDMGLDVTDDEAPLLLRRALANITMSKDNTMNQYSDALGKPRLLKAIAELYSKRINRELDPEKNVIATVGAHEALVDTLRAFTNPGDEWILIEPFWSKYVPMIKLLYGVPRFTALKLYKDEGDINGNDWILDQKEFESLVNQKTRGILFNNPNNPTGKVYSLDDMNFIANLAKKYNLLVISDEAHEWIVYEPYKLIRMASLPGMFERTITIGSASKSFSVAGWRIGWAYGPADYISKINNVHDYFVQSAATPQQIAIAIGFENEIEHFGQPSSHFVQNAESSMHKRDFMVQAFRDAGMQPIVPNGGYCMLASWKSPAYRALMSKSGSDDPNTRFVNFINNYVGVHGYAGSTFFSQGHSARGRDYIRFCFQKKDETLQSARQHLLKLKPNYQV